MKEWLSSVGGCLTLIVINLVLGWWTFSFDIWVLFGKQLPWYIDAIAGVLLAEVTFPLAVVLWIGSALGVFHGPLF